MQRHGAVSSDAVLRSFCLGLIVVQNSSLILVTSYSRSLTPAYLPSVAVFLGEVLKLVLACLLLAHELRSELPPSVTRHRTRRAVAAAAAQVRGLLAEHGWETSQFAVPALCYTLQNNLWYHALSHLDPITAAVTSQMKVMTTALASVLMLGRRLSLVQWVALFVLMLGMIVMQMPADAGTPARAPTQPTQQTELAAGALAGAAASAVAAGGAVGGAVGGAGAAGAAGAAGRRLAAAAAEGGGGARLVPQNTLGGATAMLLATVLSAYAGVFLEKLFKTLRLTLWLQSVQLSLFALPVSAVTMCIYDAQALKDGELFVGFNRWAWLTVVLSAVGGIAVSMALKYADNILKTFAVGISIVLNCAVSALFLGVKLSGLMCLGVGLVVGSTFMFNAKSVPDLPTLISYAADLLARVTGADASRAVDEEALPLNPEAGEVSPEYDASPDYRCSPACATYGASGGVAQRAPSALPPSLLPALPAAAAGALASEGMGTPSKSKEGRTP